MFFTSRAIIKASGGRGKASVLASHRQRIPQAVPVVLTVWVLSMTGAWAQTSAPVPDKKGGKSASAVKPAKTAKPDGKVAKPIVVATGAPTPVQLAYQFTPGASYRYHLTALFDGHIPPFAQPDSPPIHLKADILYIATVKKADKTGATVDFNVDSAELTLFENEIKEDEKLDPDKVTTFPIALQDVQNALNATAVLRPDGSVANILSKSSVKVPLDVGFDIRKLFLMLMPVTFSNQPVKVGDAWTANDGVLGSKSGRITYRDKLDAATLQGRQATYRLSQVAASVVEDKLDKAGNSTTKNEDVYRTLAGKLDLTGEMKFTVPVGSLAKPPVLLGQVQSAHLVLNANINRKRVKINPDQPEIPENDPLDVKGRITVVRDDTPVKTKPAAKTALTDKQDGMAASNGAKTALKTK